MVWHLLICEGLIGAGKSTICRALLANARLRARYEQIVMIPEPLAEWEASGRLAAYYKDIAGEAASFQHYALTTRSALLHKAAHDKPTATNILFISERSLYADRYVFAQMLAEDGFISPMQMMEYVQAWQEVFAQLPVQPTHRLYLEVPTTVCMARVAARARSAEELLTLSYQEKLQVAHEDYLQAVTLPTLRLINAHNLSTAELAPQITQIVDFLLG